MTQLISIAALSRNHVIGRDNALPWHLPDDFKHFKTVTTGSPIIMGRKTFESIGRLLPNRLNIIVSRQQNYPVPEGALLVDSLAAAIAAVQGEDKAFIIGGGTLYREAMPMVDKLYLTLVDVALDGDVTFPPFADEFEQVESVAYPQDERHAHAFQITAWARKTSLKAVTD